MRILLIAALCVGLAGCSGAPRTVAPLAAEQPGVHATLSRAAGGEWVLDYRFDRSAPAWFFIRSANDLDGKPWRAQSWRVETPGVRIERIGHHDVMTGDGRPLTAVRIRVKPYTDSLAADYTPVLGFSDGGVALYTEHHLVAPLPTAAAARDLPPDLNGVSFDQTPVRLTVQDPGRALLIGGRLHRDSVQIDLNQGGTYVYSGPARAVTTPAFAGIIDPGLPGWARDELERFMPRLFEYYTARLGRPDGNRPTALVAWGGVDFKGVSQGGSVLDGMVVMNIKGAKMAMPSPEVTAHMRWFLGHEAAHFWMGQTIRYSRRSEAWMMEGAADLMAVRALKHFQSDYDDRAMLQSEIDDCIKVNGTRPLSGASERGDHRANYACGAVLMMAAEGAARKQDGKGDLYTWLRGMIDRNRAGRTVTAETWLAAFAAADGAHVAQVRTFLERGVAHPASFIHDLLAANGMAVSRNGERVVLN